MVVSPVCAVISYAPTVALSSRCQACFKFLHRLRHSSLPFLLLTRTGTDKVGDCSNSLIKMGSASGLVIGTSIVFYLIAFGLALGAMSKRSKGDVTLIDEDMGTLKCQYSTDLATGLAAGAFLFLLVAQTFVMAITKCLCCGSSSKPGGARTFAFILFIFSWISFIIASAALIAAASQNKIQTKGLFSTSGPDVTCKQVQKSLFAAAAAFTFITMLTTEIYYVLISMARDGGSAWPSYNGHNGPSVGGSAYT